MIEFGKQTKFVFGLLFCLMVFGFLFVQTAVAQTPKANTPVGQKTATISSQEATPSTEAAQTQPSSSQDIVQSPKERIGELELALRSQDPGNIWLNPLKHAIRRAVASGVELQTLVILILFPLVAAFIAAARHLVGLRGFGILLPAALSVVFLETGPVLGIGLFLVIVVASVAFRFTLRFLKVRLQYLPRMALILWAVVLGVLGLLFSAPLIPQLDIPDVSIFPVLILVLLSEDFTRVQLGKSIGVAITLTSETLILALISFLILSLKPVQYVVLLNPEAMLIGVAIFDLFLGRYVGLRFMEFWRFRKLIRG